MRTLMSALAIIALSTGAQAACFPIPDTAASNYVDNSLRHTLCLQDQLSQSTDEHERQTQTDATLNQLQRDSEQQRLQLQQQQSLTLMRPRF